VGSESNLNKIDEFLKELDAIYLFFNNSYKGISRYIKILPIL